MYVCHQLIFAVCLLHFEELQSVDFCQIRFASLVQIIFRGFSITVLVQTSIKISVVETLISN